MSTQENLSKAFQAFLADEKAVQAAICDSTAAGFSGSYAAVELFPDEHFRVLWSGHIGNLYNSPGVIIPVPGLADDEYDDDAGEYFFENALDALRERAEYMIGLVDDGARQ